MTPTTMSSPTFNRNTSTREADASRDRVLGAIVTLGACARPIGLTELRAHLSDLGEEELDRVFAALDRDGVVVLDRGTDGTTVRLAQASSISENVPESLRDRLLGATWQHMAPYGTAPIAMVRRRLADIPQMEFERAVAALMMSGEIELARGSDGPAIRVRRSRHAPIDFGMFRTGHEHACELQSLTRRIAHQLWEVRGYRHGAELQDWADAERMAHAQLCH